MTYHRIELSYAVFAIAEIKGQIVKTAPIGRWMLGKSILEIRSWVLSKKGKIIELVDSSKASSESTSAQSPCSDSAES